MNIWIWDKQVLFVHLMNGDIYLLLIGQQRCCNEASQGDFAHACTVTSVELGSRYIPVFTFQRELQRVCFLGDVPPCHVLSVYDTRWSVFLSHQNDVT